MRFSSIVPSAVLLLVGCGGRVVVDHGAGGAGGAGSASSSASVGAGGRPPCDTLGYVGVGAGCSIEGQECAMPGTCCGEYIVCKGGRWTVGGPLCNSLCQVCGAGLESSEVALCIQDDIHDVEVGFRCAAPDPCPPGSPSCDCGASVCESASLFCVGGHGATLVCTDGTKHHH
jgi:hypothetical protein